MIDIVSLIPSWDFPLRGGSLNALQINLENKNRKKNRTFRVALISATSGKSRGHRISKDLDELIPKIESVFKFESIFATTHDFENLAPTNRAGRFLDKVILICEA